MMETINKESVVVEKLDRLIILFKLFNKETMQEIKQEIMSDHVKVKILEYLCYREKESRWQSILRK